MKRFEAAQQWFYGLLAVSLVGGTLLGVFWLFAKAIEKGATVLAAILASFATVGAAVIVRYFERRKEGEAARREHLGKLYEEFASALAGEVRTQRAVEKTITGFRRKALVYASPAVLKKFHTWRAGLPTSEDPPRAEELASVLRYEELIKAMRRDLGTGNFSLNEGDLARAMLDDFDTYYGEPEPATPPEPLGDEPRVTDNSKRSGRRSEIT